MTKIQFLAAYRHRLVAEWPWARDSVRLLHYMARVESALAGCNEGWIPTGPTIEAMCERYDLPLSLQALRNRLI